MEIFLTFVSIVIIGAAIDVLSLYFLTGSYFKRKLLPLLIIEDGKVKTRGFSAPFIYVCAAISVVFFVLPKINPLSPISSSIFWGALMGFSFYGVYEFVNYTVIREWKKGVVIIDIIWGTFFVAILSLIAHYLNAFFIK